LKVGIERLMTVTMEGLPRSTSEERDDMSVEIVEDGRLSQLTEIIED
jgi:hypothetical protein